MSGKIINLRQARKGKARQEKAARADENAVKHGLPKAVRSLDAARREKDARDLDGKKRD